VTGSRGPQDSWRPSRAEAIARQIQARILDASLGDGVRLGTKEDLRREYGVAVGTVNEAVRLLETQGLVSAKPGPGGGLFVTSPSSHVRLNHLILALREEGNTGADCLAVRNALEELVLLDAARVCTPEDLRDLREILEELARHKDDADGFLRANWALHRRMAEMSPNAVLRAVYITLLDTIENELEDVQPDEIFEGGANLRVHIALIDAVESGDPARIRRAVRRHAPPVQPGD
jgi:DNA-binding FadR family transcriptional regulator